MHYRRAVDWLQRVRKVWERWTEPVFPKGSININDGLLHAIRPEGFEVTASTAEITEIYLMCHNMITYDAVFLHLSFKDGEQVAISELDISLVETILHLADHFTISDGWHPAISRLEPGEHHILFPPEPNSEKVY